MKKTLIVLSAAAMALTTMSAAGAQPYRDRDRDGVPNRYDRHDDRRGHHWSKGQRLDARHHNRSYMVSDYRRHGWRAPPRGYAYYRTDTGDVVLAAIATGVIASVLAGSLAQ